MIVRPKIWGFICTTAHPSGCEKNVREQIAATRTLGLRRGGPTRVLVIGASTGYGLAARITAAFGFGAATLGLFFEKPGRGPKTATAGWYNSAAFHRAAREVGLPTFSLNGDAFSDAARSRALDLIRNGLGGPVDLVVYSLASPLRRRPGSETAAHTALKPIGAPYSGKSIDTDKDRIVHVEIPSATEHEIEETVAVMGGEDWALWIDTLAREGLLAPGAKSVALSYIGPEVTWPIYWQGTLGRAKLHLEATAKTLRERHRLDARVAVMKSIVTQASAAIPVLPLYVSLVFKVMKEKGLHEGAIEQMNRLFRDFLYREDGRAAALDGEGRLRLDERELREDVQRACKDLWPKVDDANLMTLTDYAGYKQAFLRQFGFVRADVDYEADVATDVDFDCIRL